MRCKKIIHNVLNFVYEIHNCVGKSYYSEVPIIRTGTYASYIAVHSMYCRTGPTYGTYNRNFRVTNIKACFHSHYMGRK